ncbi:hypothetical protein niasHS_006108 [Heterodera schachtii]|uniref:Uncharacterized protein n=1 Tax=Heterodera schachtii TaxID=97005 RepID=A0ABD2JW62_HETSC
MTTKIGDGIVSAEENGDKHKRWCQSDDGAGAAQRAPPDGKCRIGPSQGRKLLNGKNKRMEEQGASEFVDVVVHPGELFVNRTHSTATFVYQACDKILPNNSLRHRMARFRLPGELVRGAAAPTILKEMNWDRWVVKRDSYPRASNKEEAKELRIAHQKRRRTEDEYHLFLWRIIPSRIRGECSCGPLCLHFSLPDLEDICIGQFGKIDRLEIDGQKNPLDLYGQPVPALGAHKNGRSTPIEPRLDYSAQSNADDHPGLGYKCGRWQVEGMVLDPPVFRCKRTNCHLLWSENGKE